MLNNEQISTIIIMRGLGYIQQEIADKLSISRKTVENWLKMLKCESTKYGIHKIYYLHINIIDFITNQIREEIKNEEENLNGKHTKRN